MDQNGLCMAVFTSTLETYDTVNRVPQLGHLAHYIESTASLLDKSEVNSLILVISAFFSKRWSFQKRKSSNRFDV